jgi:hypothetical protein
VALVGHHLPPVYPPGDVIDEYLYVHAPPVRHVPSEGRESLRLNLWLNNGGTPAPAGGQAIEVVVRDVVYLPEPAPWLGTLVGWGALGRLARRRRQAR